MERDAANLHLLSVLYYVAGAFCGLLLLLALICLAVGITCMVGLVWEGASPVLFGSILIGTAAAGILIFAGAAVIFCRAARCLAERCHYNFCVVAAAVCCLFFPPGTILGVYTLSVLTRPAVREMFGVAGGAPEVGAGV
jgi:hypothetical protein